MRFEPSRKVASMLPRCSGTCQDPFQRSLFYCRPNSVGRKCQRERAATINTPLQQNKHRGLDRALLTFDLIPGEQTQRRHMMKTQAVSGGRRRFVGKRTVLQPGHPTLNVIPVSMTTQRSPSSICCCKDRWPVCTRAQLSIMSFHANFR